MNNLVVLEKSCSFYILHTSPSEYFIEEAKYDENRFMIIDNFRCDTDSLKDYELTGQIKQFCNFLFNSYNDYIISPKPYGVYTEEDIKELFIDAFFDISFFDVKDEKKWFRKTGLKEVWIKEPGIYEMKKRKQLNMIIPKNLLIVNN